MINEPTLQEKLKLHEDWDSPMRETHFFLWLEKCHYPSGIFHVALAQYLLGTSNKHALKGTFKSCPETLENLKHIFQHFWWLRLRNKPE